MSSTIILAIETYLLSINKSINCSTINFNLLWCASVAAAIALYSVLIYAS